MSYIAGCLELESFCRHYMTSSQEVKSLKKKKPTHTQKKKPQEVILPVCLRHNNEN